MEISFGNMRPLLSKVEGGNGKKKKTFHRFTGLRSSESTSQEGIFTVAQLCPMLSCSSWEEMAGAFNGFYGKELLGSPWLLRRILFCTVSYMNSWRQCCWVFWGSLANNIFIGGTRKCHLEFHQLYLDISVTTAFGRDRACPTHVDVREVPLQHWIFEELCSWVVLSFTFFQAFWGQTWTDYPNWLKYLERQWFEYYRRKKSCITQYASIFPPAFIQTQKESYCGGSKT